MSAVWSCPQCGSLNSSKIALYQEGDLFNTHSKRFDPWCIICGKTVILHNDGDDHRVCSTDPPARVMIIIGTCASGKSTISYLLSENYDFVQIDGDWILDKWKAEQGRKVDFNEIHSYMLNMTEGLVSIGKSVVIAHIILPEFLTLYEDFLRQRGIDYRSVILMPQMPVLLQRNTHRKCWPNPTPEYWVHKFYQDFLNDPKTVRAYFYDNSHETAEETAENILKLFDDHSNG